MITEESGSHSRVWSPWGVSEVGLVTDVVVVGMVGVVVVGMVDERCNDNGT